MNKQPAAPNPQKPWLLGAIIVLVTVGAFWPAFSASFVWDDYTMVSESVLLRGPLRIFWFSAVPPDYFPLTYTSLWLEWRLWGDNPMGYHIVNVALHALSCVILWRTLERLKLPGAFLGALLFAVHPVTVESVAWVAERKNTLAMLFYMLTAWSFVCFAQTGKWRHYIFALVAFALSLLAKTSAVAWPFVALGILCVTRQVFAGEDRVRKFGACVLWTTPFFLISLGLGLLTVWFQYHRAIGKDVIHHHDFLTRLAGAGCSVWFYLWKAVVPYPLSFVYPLWKIDGRSLVVFLPAVALVALLAFLFWRKKAWSRAAGLALIYFVLLLAPVLGFVNIYFQRYSYVADHWQYFALPAMTTLVAMGLTRLKWGYRVGGFVVALLAVMTFARARVYHDEQTLWTDTLSKDPNCWVAYNNLGYLQQRQGNTTAACELYQKSIGIFFDQAEAHNNLGCALLNTGRTDEALEELRIASRINPDYPTVYYLLGSGYQRLGKTAEAMAAYREAIRSQPDYSPAYNNLACLLVMTGQPGEAERLLRRALQLNDEYAEAMVNLAAVLNDSGRQKDAVPLLEKAIRIIPNNVDGHVNLGNALYALNQTAAAKKEFVAALELDTKQCLAHFGLGNCLMRNGDLAEARKCYEKALAINPGHAESHYQLSVVLAAEKQNAAAIAQLREAVRLKPDWVVALNNLAWAIATDSASSATSRADAVRCAQRAVELSQANNAEYLDTLAVACASNNDFANATNAAQRALALARAGKQTNLVADLERRLALYAQKKRYIVP